MPKKVKEKIPIQQLRVLLIKSNYVREEDIIKDLDKLDIFQLDSSVPYKGTLFVKPQYTKTPSWHKYIRPYVSGTSNELKKFDKLQNTSTAAVLVLESEKRKFALTFGYGRNLLNPESLERDFGLKVVLNRVDPESLRSVDCRTFEELTLQTRRQTSRGSSLDTFGLNVTQDLLRQVTGTPSSKHKDFARKMAGSDGLMLSVPIKFVQLAIKCKELLAAYNDKEYKKRFEFIDRLRSERDPVKLDVLDQMLIEKLKKGDLECIHMAPPEPIDWHDLDGFTYTGRKDEDVSLDLDIDAYIQMLGKDKDITIDFLKRSRIGVRYVGSSQTDDRWNVYQCIVFETNYNNQFYVLTCGDWYEIEKDFVKHVNKHTKTLVNEQFLLPDAKRNEKEGDYNARVGREQGYAVVDKKCPRVGGSGIEPCDLFTPLKQFIHVKKKTRSATLSHLFAQGTVSAETFISDTGFRNALRDIVAKQNPEQVKYIPEKRPAPNDYVIVYAIITKAAKNWPISLPFFSKLNLMNAANHLEMLGFRVTLVRINEK